MSAAKHTLGPWNAGGVDGTVVYSLALNERVASTFDSYDRTLNELQANARLIAAAPELLEALKSIVECEKRRAADLRHRKAWQLVKFSEDRVAQAEAAITKATGGAA